MTEFYAYGGGSPVYPPEDNTDDDNSQDPNFIPVPLPPHLSVMVAPTTTNADIISGPPASQGLFFYNSIF